MKIEITNEQLEKMAEAIKMFKKVWDEVVKAVKKAMDAIKEIFRAYCNAVGYKRLRRKAEIEYLSSISIGRSNNWRKAHGLSLIRKRQLIILRKRACLT